MSMSLLLRGGNLTYVQYTLARYENPNSIKIVKKLNFYVP